MKKLILAGIATLSFIGNIQPTQSTYITPSFQLFSSAMAQEDDEDGGGLEHIEIEGERPIGDDRPPGTPGGGAGGGVPGGGNGGPTGGGGTIDAVEQCVIGETARHQGVVRRLNLLLQTGLVVCAGGGYSLGTLAAIFGTPLAGPPTAIITGALCAGYINTLHGNAVASATVVHERNKAKCD